MNKPEMAYTMVQRPDGRWVRVSLDFTPDEDERRANMVCAVIPKAVACSDYFDSWQELVRVFPEFQRKKPYQRDVSFDKGLKVGGDGTCIGGEKDRDPENGIVLDRGVLYITISGKRHRVAMADELEKITFGSLIRKAREAGEQQ